MIDVNHKLIPSDVAVIRDLARRVREAAESPENRERIRLWYQHDTGIADRQLILTELDGGLQLILPDFVPKCRELWAQAQELGLMQTLVHHEIIRDDFPVEPRVALGWDISISNYGVQGKNTYPETKNGNSGAFHINKAIEDLERDFHLLQPRTYSVDRESTMTMKAILDEVYDGILDVFLVGKPWWTMGLTMYAISLIGLEDLMVYMYDQPKALHRLMGFIRDEHLSLLDWMENEGLLSLNNKNDYIGSGSRGYSRAFPMEGQTYKRLARTQDIWTLIESQETVGVGPNQYAEFIFPYENTIAERFGAVYYGCCEPIHSRWSILKDMSNLKRVSISPWCDQAFMAEALGDRFVYSRKPNPTLVSTEHFNCDLIREDLRSTLSVTTPNHCRVEIVMKDVHTLGGEPDRLSRWVALAREVIEEYI